MTEEHEAASVKKDTDLCKKEEIVGHLLEVQTQISSTVPTTFIENEGNTEISKSISKDLTTESDSINNTISPNDPSDDIITSATMAHSNKTSLLDTEPIGQLLDDPPISDRFTSEDFISEEPVPDDEDDLSEEDDIVINTSYTHHSSSSGYPRRFLTGTNIWVRSSIEGAPDGSKGGVSSTLTNSLGQNTGLKPPQNLDSDGYPFIEDLQRTFSRTAFDVRMDDLEEAPWRRPGVDLSDYFNYGFTEQAWRAYAKVQLRLRYDREKKNRELFLNKQRAAAEALDARKVAAANPPPPSSNDQEESQSQSPHKTASRLLSGPPPSRGPWSGPPRGPPRGNTWAQQNSVPYGSGPGGYGAPSGWQGGMRGGWGPGRNRPFDDRREMDTSKDKDRIIEDEHGKVKDITDEHEKSKEVPSSSTEGRKQDVDSAKRGDSRGREKGRVDTGRRNLDTGRRPESREARPRYSRERAGERESRRRGGSREMDIYREKDSRKEGERREERKDSTKRRTEKREGQELDKPKISIDRDTAKQPGGSREREKHRDGTVRSGGSRDREGRKDASKRGVREGKEGHRMGLVDDKEGAKYVQKRKMGESESERRRRLKRDDEDEYSSSKDERKSRRRKS